MKLRIVPFQRANAAWNLALEEALFLKSKQAALKGTEVQPIVKTYSFTKPSVILGYMQKLNEINKQFCDDHKIDVTMRTTGGGSVYLGRNDVQYSMILPQHYSKQLLTKINSSIVNAMQDVGFSPQLLTKTGHSVVRLDKRGVIFDAQRRFKHVLLHHGTTLVDNYDYEHMPSALRATKEELEIVTKGNIWLREKQQVRERALIKAFEKNLPEDSSVVVKDYTLSEIKLARKLYNDFYTNTAEISGGKKDYGICYKTDSAYNMEQYVNEDD